MEKLLLSRIESATSISEVGSVTGIPESDAHRAVCALVAAGFLKVLGHDKDVSSEEHEVDAEAMERLREDIARRLHFYSSADHYEVLGLSRQATSAEIKAAYYHLAKKFHPDRHRHSEQGELQTQLETLFALITQAYDTLTDAAQRSAYDDRIRKTPGSGSQANGSPAIKVDAPSQQRPQAGQSNGSGESQALLSGLSVHSHSLRCKRGEPPQPTRNPVVNPAPVAEHLQPGAALFEKKQYHGAVHMLREAVNSMRAARRITSISGWLWFETRERGTRRGASDKAAELDPYNGRSE